MDSVKEVLALLAGRVPSHSTHVNKVVCLTVGSCQTGRIHSDLIAQASCKMVEQARGSKQRAR
jgi:hypothetical protein